MFETIKRLYAKTHNAAVVTAAVRKGWITQEQANSITGNQCGSPETAPSSFGGTADAG